MRNITHEVESLAGEVFEFLTPFEAFEAFFFELDDNSPKYSPKFLAVDKIIAERHSGSLPVWYENDEQTPDSIRRAREACSRFMRSGIEPNTLLTVALEWFVVMCRERTKLPISESEGREEQLLSLESDLECLRKVFEIVKRKNRD